MEASSSAGKYTGRISYQEYSIRIPDVRSFFSCYNIWYEIKAETERGFMIYLGIIAVAVVPDLILKSAIERLPDESFPRELPGSGGRLQLRKLHNMGFLMGFLRQYPELVRGLPLAVASVILLRFSLRLPCKGSRLEKAGLAAVLGGAASNLFDRFFRGYVVDYLYVDVRPLNKIIFNIGDLFIALGMLLSGAAGLLRTVQGMRGGLNRGRS